jgi:hypothetical protein
MNITPSKGPECPHRVAPLTQRAPILLSTFRMNTCKSVTKQRTLSLFRMNTYAETGGGVSATLRSPRLSVILCPVCRRSIVRDGSTRSALRYPFFGPLFGETNNADTR